MRAPFAACFMQGQSYTAIPYYATLLRGLHKQSLLDERSTAARKAAADSARQGQHLKFQMYLPAPVDLACNGSPTAERGVVNCCIHYDMAASREKE